MFVKEVAPPDINHQPYYAPFLSPTGHGPASPWTLLQDYHGQTETMPFG